MKTIFFLITCLACYTLSYPNKTSYYSNFPFPFVNRVAWGARPPRSTTSLNTPVPYVVIHHTYIPPVCLTRAQCEANMRSMQQTHMDTNGWADIGYNFAVGGEGSVYEGRSWQTVGAHAVGYNVQSIGIVLIGNFISQVPGEKQVQTTKELIAAGVRLGFIRPDYKLITHRQVTATECPGDALYNEVATWDHFFLGSSDYPFQFVNRSAWGARPPRSTTSLNTPVPYVVIHHTYIPPVCLTRAQCEANMRSMQQTHMDTNGWADIGYNFAVGGEGSVYEGRSWQAVGAHAVGYNVQSIGIVLIGNFISQVPEAIQLQTTKELIAAGVRLGFIRPDYKLITHRQVTATECPGDALYNEVATWDHFSLGSSDYPFQFINRAAWGARPPRSTTSLNTPVPYVVIHHTYIPPVCLTRAQCEANMRSMQQTHMDTNGWADIGYNFAVGGEGSVYEGRSWQAVGAHAVGYNVQSIGIVLIGNFISQVPEARQLETTKELIAAGVRLGFIRPDYKLITHRQAAATECPGDALYNEVATWDRFSLV